MSVQLEIAGLAVAFRDHREERPLLEDVSLSLERGEILGLVGESGSGKSLLCRTIIGLIPSRKLRVTQGSVRLDGDEILGRDMQAVRGRRIGMIFQNPTSHLDPVMTIGRQISEGLRHHKGLDDRTARAEAIALLTQVGFPDPARAVTSYAHQFSGGMRQRAMIAIALACDPEILIADEPTTALDVTVQAQILRLLMELRDRRGLSIILITHDLGVVAQTCDRIAVMRHGKVVEVGEKRALLAAPQHPYTRELIASHPSMPHPEDAVITHPHDRRPIFEIDDLDVSFPVGGGFLTGKREVRALKGVSLRIWPGETVGIVGESGSGKSTLARAMLGLTRVSAGDIAFDGNVLTKDRDKTLKHLRSDAAMVFQDPFNSLNPRLTIGQTLAEVLKTQGETRSDKIPSRIGELLDLVGLDRSFAARRPRSLSGGQCQRAGIARALAVNPRVIIADECVAALDVTIQAQIVDLFRDLTQRTGLTLVFIAHDLAIVRNLCERVIVMHHGEIVEDGPSARVFHQPERRYTAQLIAAIPDINPDRPINCGPPSTQQEYVT
ncbi:MAG: ABC transporter ATP-binding protein [Rhodobacteraceae bacterium]|jgi:peptide/nickel transport system ATP-binding protein|uniref:dipeptide ABC transporter ATP-binding protein n=1 Tax=Albidovulum sp. TaxID=1872424 RepID=UPI001DCBD0D8|nr:ABC transporter ATP-binding protein [uncultured Defluviimonas sp.]MCB2125797.1 ABC transporter ATP-binding protein [Paracoccaceae bacterium]MCC0068303.1 ABC transporter ATP-binding protein [Paracoccaceae bacterium]